MSYLAQAGLTLVQFVLGLYLLLVLLRLLLQSVRADFYNPISQAIVTLTNPPLRFLRRFIPGLAGIDLSAIVLLVLLQMLELVLIALLLHGGMPKPAALLVLSLAELLRLAIYVYIFLIFIMVIISWINPGAYNPLTVLIHQLTEPLLRPIRRRLPTTAGLDWSPLAALLALYLLLALGVAPLMDLGSSLAGR